MEPRFRGGAPSEIRQKLPAADAVDPFRPEQTAAGPVAGDRDPVAAAEVVDVRLAVVAAQRAHVDLHEIAVAFAQDQVAQAVVDAFDDAAELAVAEVATEPFIDRDTIVIATFVARAVAPRLTVAPCSS